MFDLTGKTALVTGASGGIGGAIARALHAQGAAVALSGTRKEALEALAAELGGARSCRPRATSPTRPRSMRSFRQAPRRRWASSTFSSTTPA
jgi:NADP-dependent 3-hydroxy acid dehydrogenase YdfG